MSDRIRLHLDEHVPYVVAVALRRRGIDITTCVDAGLRMADDHAHLAFAQRQSRVIVTQDADFLRLHALGAPHAGIVFCPMGERSIGHMIEMLRLMVEVMTPEDMANRVEFIWCRAPQT